jgi:hypothetical protein
MRTPKNFSPVSEISGKVKVNREDGYVMRVRNAR